MKFKTLTWEREHFLKKTWNVEKIKNWKIEILENWFVMQNCELGIWTLEIDKLKLENIEQLQNWNHGNCDLRQLKT